VFTPGLFDGRTVIVTGGGSGIGRCIAHELAALGASVAVVGRTPEKLTTVAEEIGADTGRRVTTHATDIRDEQGVMGAIEEILDAHGRVDGLVNNAGGQFRAPVESMSTKGFEAVLRTNLTGGFVMMREVHNRWMGGNGGAIVNIVADFWGGWPGFGHSVAARAGMATLTETVATEWAAEGVRVNSVAPGPIASSGLDSYDPADEEFLRKQVANEVPLGRFGTEAEVSAAVVFLLSPASAFITGTCLRVDGGVPNVRPGWWELKPPERGEPFTGFHRAAAPRLLGDH
jgi:citronellol/citronellal dehydrogenase